MKSILVHLDASETLGARLQLADRLARVHGASVEALYAVLPAVLQNPFAFSAEDASAVALLVEFEEAQRARAQAAFECAASSLAGADTMRWRQANGEPVGAFTQRAWGADLLLLSQHDPSGKQSSGVPSDFAAAVLMQTGRPGLCCPYIGASADIGGRVMVAWKATPESARAVTAALPFLQRAREVHVAAWDEAGGGDAGAAIEPYFRHHGIAVTLHREGPPTRDLGDLMLSRAADIQADLLVMGCYGHGRAREWVLGGVTRTVLRSMTLPVLMVH
ncbi:MAG: universal stress protein [Betaproteobacteria bacterium]|nr:universal stress protein [Betaproteobacteria bacterium]